MVETKESKKEGVVEAKGSEKKLTKDGKVRLFECSCSNLLIACLRFSLHNGFQFHIFFPGFDSGGIHSGEFEGQGRGWQQVYMHVHKGSEGVYVCVFLYVSGENQEISR